MELLRTCLLEFLIQTYQKVTKFYFIDTCLTCMNFSLNKDTITSPLFSVMTSARDTEEEYLSDYVLNEETSLNNLHLKYKNSFLSANPTVGLKAAQPSSSSISPTFEPIRVTAMFNKPSSFAEPSLNKREMKEESLKKRSMSYDLKNNVIVCNCCGKQDLSVLPQNESGKSDNSYLCTKCSSALKKKQDYASTKGGSARVSSKGSNLVEFTCEKGHSWSVNLHRGYKNWCSTCLKLVKEELKRQYKKRSSKIHQENVDKQKKLFDNAKEVYVKSLTQAPKKEGNLEDLFEAITPIAKVKADAYFSHPDASQSCTYEQALTVYKVLELDVDRVQFILSRMSANSKKVGYKKLALTLHPDKNRHPLSNEAFLKASELFNGSS